MRSHKCDVHHVFINLVLKYTCIPPYHHACTSRVTDNLDESCSIAVLHGYFLQREAILSIDE